MLVWSAKEEKKLETERISGKDRFWKFEILRQALAWNFKLPGPFCYWKTASFRQWSFLTTFLKEKTELLLHKK